MMDNVESLLMQRLLFRDLRVFCNRHGKDFSDIVTYFEKNPAQLNIIEDGRPLRLTAKSEIEKIIGVSVETARKTIHVKS